MRSSGLPLANGGDNQPTLCPLASRLADADWHNGSCCCLFGQLQELVFPAAFPTGISLLIGMTWQALPLVLNSGLLALSAAFLSVTVCFHGFTMDKSESTKRMLQLAIYLPLLVPQISFIWSTNWSRWAGMDGMACTNLYPHDFHPTYV